MTTERLPTMSVRALSVCIIVCLAAQPARAAFFGFENITNNDSGSASIGEAQLFVELTDPGGDQVSFTFHNKGPQASTISEVYYDDGTLLALSQIDNSGGVAFRRDADPPNLPGGNLVSPPFQVTAGFLAEAIPPSSQNGVNPGDTLGILFDLQTGRTFGDVLNDLGSGALRIGLHVIAFTNGESESFVNTPVIVEGGLPIVPEPSSFFLAMSLILCGAGYSCCRRTLRAR